MLLSVCRISSGGYTLAIYSILRQLLHIRHIYFSACGIDPGLFESKRSDELFQKRLINGNTDAIDRDAFRVPFAEPRKDPIKNSHIGILRRAIGIHCCHGNVCIKLPAKSIERNHIRLDHCASRLKQVKVLLLHGIEIAVPDNLVVLNEGAGSVGTLLHAVYPILKHALGRIIHIVPIGRHTKIIELYLAQRNLFFCPTRCQQIADIHSMHARDSTSCTGLSSDCDDKPFKMEKILSKCVSST